MSWELSITEFSRSCSFEGVTVWSSDEAGDRGHVHFTAHLRRKREDVSFEEHSVFVRRDGRWLYYGTD